MKTFKHRKTGEIATYKDGCFKQGSCVVEIGVEPSSEFWEELKSPLFRSEDGVYIYDDVTTVYCVHINDLELTSCHPDSAFMHNLKDNLKVFSTKQAAEKYILFNKPCLSIKEICPIIGQCNETTHINLDKLTTRLENLVKSKTL